MKMRGGEEEEEVLTTTITTILTVEEGEVEKDTIATL